MTSKNRSQAQTTRAKRERSIRCTREVRGKRVRSVFVSAVDEYNVVTIDFTDDTALTVQIIPTVRLKAQLNDWSSDNAKLLKTWPVLITG